MVLIKSIVISGLLILLCHNSILAHVDNTIIDRFDESAGWGREVHPDNPFLWMNHGDSYFPLRLNYLMPKVKDDVYDRNFGFEYTNVWSCAATDIFILKYQVSCIYLSRERFDGDESIIIPLVTSGLQINLFGDSRIAIKPYTTIGWNPSYYHYEGMYYNNYSTGTYIYEDDWYFNSWAWNYGVDIDFWISKGFGISMGYEQTVYLASMGYGYYECYAQDSYLRYSTFKIGLIF